MAELVTTGTWTVDPTREVAFVEAWASFAEWATSMPGAGTLRLGRDATDPRRFVSYGDWKDADAAHAWKSDPAFREQMARVLQHVADFSHTELEVVASGMDGTSALYLLAHGGARETQRSINDID